MTKQKEKTCFVIMPISDQEGYDKGHFKRVYEHLIKPACEKAGFVPLRADDEVKTNYIVIDIIKKILDSEMVICDLSSKNPNVFYELGIRQAFNKKAVLIKDIQTGRVFDIQGLRALDYDESLRIDSVQKNIDEIANTIKETYEHQGDDINSLIQLLSIQPAKLSDSFELSNESSLILKAIDGIQSRIGNIENHQYIKPSTSFKADSYIIDGIEFKMDWVVSLNHKDLGKVIRIETDKVILKNNKNQVVVISKDNPDFKKLQCLPF